MTVISCIRRDLQLQACPAFASAPGCARLTRAHATGQSQGNLMNIKKLVSIIMVVFIDLLGFSLILPLLPYYAESFHADAIQTGLLVASYAVAQLIGAPLLGRLSDRYGRRPILLLSVAGTFVGFLLLGFADP